MRVALFGKEPDLLFKLAQESREKIVEIGSFQGGSTMFLVKGSRAGGRHNVYSVDKHEDHIGQNNSIYTTQDWAEWYKAMLLYSLHDLARPIGLWSQEAVCSGLNNIGLLFIDGDHTEPSIRRDFELYSPLVIADGKIAFHDSDMECTQKVLADLPSMGWEKCEEEGKITVWRRKNAQA